MEVSPDEDSPDEDSTWYEAKLNGVKINIDINKSIFINVSV
tara:strand:- start:636 stop:758 length:123 start_codon:yes stop_codon:yes gene_type:complete